MEHAAGLDRPANLPDGDLVLRPWIVGEDELQRAEKPPRYDWKTEEEVRAGLHLLNAELEAMGFTKGPLMIVESGAANAVTSGQVVSRIANGSQPLCYWSDLS